MSVKESWVCPNLKEKQCRRSVKDRPNLAPSAPYKKHGKTDLGSEPLTKLSLR